MAGASCFLGTVLTHVETSRIQENESVSGHRNHKERFAQYTPRRGYREQPGADSLINLVVYQVPMRSTRPDLICMPCEALMGSTEGSQEWEYSTSSTRQAKARPKTASIPPPMFMAKPNC